MPKPHLLIVEGNPPDGVTASRTATGLSAAERYAESLRAFAPLDITITEPLSPDATQPDLASFDGMVITGSGVPWTATEDAARPFRDLTEAAFVAGLPVLGSCWGLQIGAAVLGGRVGPGPNGVERAIARGITATDHPFHAGRTGPFDALCMHRDDVLEPPAGAKITASNAHTTVQAMVYEDGAVSFWGVQYHPEVTLTDIAFWLSRTETACDGHDPSLTDLFRAAAAEPARASTLIDAGPDLLDRGTHMRELGNWLSAKILT